ncbi:MAG: hypothetical protein JSR77_00715 [Planctomycetes bacterium]|nr:hypothetical protein [Planctomycetota bacterium]
MIRLCLAFLSVVLCAAMTAAAAINNPEIEPNDSKAAATFANSAGPGMDAADTITGTTTGSSGSGAGSADYFLVKTKARAVAPYKYQLVLTSATPGHTITVRGLTQTLGVINAGTDAEIQVGEISFPGTPANSRTIQWYGFGRSEQIYIRITGTAATTAPYSAELTVTTETPVALAGPVLEGSITLERSAASTTDADFWMYNGSYFAISNFGNDQPNRLTRNYTPGTYYVAYSNTNLANSYASPADDANRNGNVLDFPDAVAISSATTGLNLDVKLTSPAGVAVGSSTKNNPFDIVFYCFTVLSSGTPTSPFGIATASPSAASNCGNDDVCFAVMAQGGQNPPSTALSVTMNLSPVGGTVVQLADNGEGCDQQANDRIFSYRFTIPSFAPPGTFTISFTIRDAQNRSYTGAFTFNVTECSLRPPNDQCEQAAPISPGQVISGTTVFATPDTSVQNCRGDVPTAPGVWYKTLGNGSRLTARLCDSPAPFDTQVSVFCGSLGCNELFCIGGDDNSCGPLSSFSWCSEPGGVYYILVHGTGSASGQFSLKLDPGSPCSNPIACAPRGACCTPNGCFLVTRAQCASANGEYRGDGSDCQTVRTTTLFTSHAPFPIAIPDASTNGASATITLPVGSGRAQSLIVGVGVRHPSAGDLLATLSHGSTTVTLFRSEGGGADLDGEYCFADYPIDYLGQGQGNPIRTRTYRSRAPLSDFDNALFAGVWTLRVYDLSADNVGAIESFDLKTASFTSACCPVCPADFDQDGGVNGSDLQAFFAAWAAATPCSDVNSDGGIDGEDVQFFFSLWEAGGCN